MFSVGQNGSALLNENAEKERFSIIFEVFDL